MFTASELFEFTRFTDYEEIEKWLMENQNRIFDAPITGAWIYNSRLTNDGIEAQIVFEYKGNRIPKMKISFFDMNLWTLDHGTIKSNKIYFGFIFTHKYWQNLIVYKRLEGSK